MKSSNPEKRLHLNLRDITALLGLLSFVGGVVTWANAQIVIPQVLEQTRRQTEQILDKHEIEAGKFFDRFFRRLDSIEADLRKK